MKREKENSGYKKKTIHRYERKQKADNKEIEKTLLKGNWKRIKDYDYQNRHNLPNECFINQNIKKAYYKALKESKVLQKVKRINKPRQQVKSYIKYTDEYELLDNKVDLFEKSEYVY